MNSIFNFCAPAICMLLVCSSAYSAPLNHAETITKIAQEIESLKSQYPQLQDFSSSNNCDSATLTINYAYKTHQANRRGGWTSGVPNPDDDGLWFYIDFHSPNSQRQIHTQPMNISTYYIGQKKVTFLILEGKKTSSINASLWKILKKYGVTEKSVNH